MKVSEIKQGAVENLNNEDHRKTDSPMGTGISKKPISMLQAMVDNIDKL